GLRREDRRTVNWSGYPTVQWTSGEHVEPNPGDGRQDRHLPQRLHLPGLDLAGRLLHGDVVCRRGMLPVRFDCASVDLDDFLGTSRAVELSHKVPPIAAL